jgi:hypothetical protein
MLSVGDRPWRESVVNNIKHYAEKCNADFILHTDVHPQLETALEQVSHLAKRKHYKISAMKSQMVYTLLNMYDRVVLVDDTVLIRHNAPNIFDIVPEDTIAAPGETAMTPDHKLDLFRHAMKIVYDFQTANNEDYIEYNVHKYFNGGFMVFSKQHQDILHLAETARCQIMLASNYPHQSLTYYQIQHNKLKLDILPPEWHCLPGIDHFTSRVERAELLDAMPHVKPTDYLVHFTGSYKHRNILIPALYKQFEEEKTSV